MAYPSVLDIVELYVPVDSTSNHDLAASREGQSAHRLLKASDRVSTFSCATHSQVPNLNEGVPAGSR